jgi:Ser/Thr protein kinase RdoA (MazF antagonist)
LLSAADDGDWVVAVFEDLDGRLLPPWLPGDLEAFIQAVASLGSIKVGTSTGLPTAVERHVDIFGGWAMLARDLDVRLDPWAASRLAQLVEIEARWPQVLAGDALVHGDLRSDNTIIDSQGRVRFVDWTQACRGSPAFDYVAMVPAMVLEGCGSPFELMAAAPHLRGLDAGDLLTLVVTIAGYFAYRSHQPTQPGLPTVRAFQAAQGDVCIDWLKTLLA